MKRFVVYYEGKKKQAGSLNTLIDVKGFYAAKQPNYEWSFTENIEEAMLYKTKKGALERKNYNYPHIAKIFEVEVITTIKIGNEIL